MSTPEEIAALKKKRTFRKFQFRGVELDKLLDLSHEELMEMVTCRARRRFSFRLARHEWPFHFGVLLLARTSWSLTMGLRAGSACRAVPSLHVLLARKLCWCPRVRLRSKTPLTHRASLDQNFRLLWWQKSLSTFKLVTSRMS